MKLWFRLAFCRSLFFYSLKMSLIVGTILMMVNYGDTFWSRGYLLTSELIKGLLNYLVPYSVSTCSSVAAYKRHHPELNDRDSND